ncbi:head-tail connector protein [Lacticaseibacillus paracasei]
MKQAMYLMIGHYYANRQDVVTGTQVNEMPQASELLLQPYRNNFIWSPLNG